MSMATARQTQSNSDIWITPQDIDRALQCYPKRNRFISEAYYSRRMLAASAVRFPHPFHEPWIEHFTREHTVTYATQASYLLIQSAIDAGDFPYLTRNHYDHVCRSELGLMSKITVRFHRAATVPSCVPIVAKIQSVRQLQDSVYAKCDYKLGDICSMEAWLTAPVG